MQQSYPDHRKHERKGIKHTSFPKDLNKQNEDGSFITSIGMVSIATRKDFLVFIISLSFTVKSDSQKYKKSTLSQSVFIKCLLIN